jgi:hypothetical protein
VQARTATALLAFTGVFVLGAVSASGHSGRPAGSVTGSDPAGDVTAQGLTAPERDAIDIVSIKAIGKEGRGVVVTVTFKGNFSALIGKGNLKNAVAALILRGKTEGSSAGVVTLGPGPLGTAARHTRSTKVGAVRAGRQLSFFVAGPGYGSVASVEAEVLVQPPALGVRTTAGLAPPVPPEHIKDAVWAAFLAAVFDDGATVSDPQPFVFEKSDNEAMLKVIDGLISRLGRVEVVEGVSPPLLTELSDLGDLSVLLRHALVNDRETGSVLSAGLRIEAGGLVVNAKNNGPNPFDALRIGLLGGVHHTGARLLTGPGSCGPGTGPSDVLCTLGTPLAPGATATVFISTDKTYDVAKGVNLFGRIPGQSVFAGPFPSAATPSACECADITVNAGVADGNVTNPRGPVSLSLIMNWTMTCAGDSGACAGRITVDPPGDLKVTSPPGGTAACTGKVGCPDTSKGRFVVRMTSAEDLHKENHDVPIAVKIVCKSGKSFVQVRTAQLVLHFGAHALLDEKLSDLRA